MPNPVPQNPVPIARAHSSCRLLLMPLSLTALATASCRSARGINSVQLFHDGARWWVVSVFWFEEDAEHPLPEHYLSE